MLKKLLKLKQYEQNNKMISLQRGINTEMEYLSEIKVRLDVLSDGLLNITLIEGEIKRDMSIEKPFLSIKQIFGGRIYSGGCPNIFRFRILSFANEDFTPESFIQYIGNSRKK